MDNSNETKNVKIYKKWWFWVIIVVVIIVIAGISESERPNTSVSEDTKQKSNKIQVVIPDFSTMDKESIQNWFESNKINGIIEEEYSDSVEKGAFISQSINANASAYEGDKVKVLYSLGKEPSTEYKNALKKAESYSKTMHMSKKGIYNQLTSEYGEKFPEDAAQYAIDNLDVDWNKNALEKAKSYQKTMNMSKQRIYDQLISEYGEKFTETEAQYAIDNLE